MVLNSKATHDARFLNISSAGEDNYRAEWLLKMIFSVERLALWQYRRLSFCFIFIFLLLRAAKMNERWLPSMSSLNADSSDPIVPRVLLRADQYLDTALLIFCS